MSKKLIKKYWLCQVLYKKKHELVYLSVFFNHSPSSGSVVTWFLF